MSSPPTVVALPRSTDVKDTTISHIESSGMDHATPAVSDASISIINTSWLSNKKIIAIAFFLNCASFEYGVDQGTVNGFQAMPGFLLVFGYADPNLPGGLGIHTTVQQLIMSLVSLGMLVSTLVFGAISGRIGRKGGIWLGCALMMVSITVQITTTSLGGLYAGRLILGFANGLLLMGPQLYMQECIPANLRTFNYTLFQVWVSIGALVGSIVDNYTATRLDRSSYQIPLGINYIMTTVLAIGLIFLPESPRLLCVRGKTEDARRSLRRLRDASYMDLQIEEELAEIRHAIQVDLEVTRGVSPADLFKPKVIKRTLTSVGVACFAGSSGSQFIIQYGVYFFMLSGNTKPFLDGVILQCLGLAGALLTPLYTGKLGKRKLFIIGGSMMTLCMLGMGVAYSTEGVGATGGRVIIAMSCIYVFFFCATVSPFCWQVAAEIPNQPLRGMTLGLASAITFTAGWLLVFTVPYFINPTSLNWGGNYAYLWVPFNLLIPLFTFFCVPETNKRTLEEIDECYNNNVPIRKFPTYECVEAKEARLEALVQRKS
ncbi:uncharacterized protein A1O5_12903 [Cladophialophora psammophila CBS 110553]|uniref:Major facilitator superfamily (MFS) profile domain-containing protein n=1 Tax=Cladophialophora psammophila CBS 110553 TaxID=1182543 RepID=W9VGV5_9EURO|nr:uncharacterized protein A1O5_12903 [Cladophialophora psammophila CBS 110553]EXJ54837.1 hypothetical protein A1O5_12903 [Cladophialophora psammophila CBS 110553]